MRFLIINDPSVLSLARMEFEAQMFGPQGDEMVEVEDKENMQPNRINQLLNPPTTGKKPTGSLGRKASKLTKTKSPKTLQEGTHNKKSLEKNPRMDKIKESTFKNFPMENKKKSWAACRKAIRKLRFKA